jgi:hypothetical protein
MVLGRFGVLVEIHLYDSFIDHCINSKYHFEIDMLIEQMV